MCKLSLLIDLVFMRIKHLVLNFEYDALLIFLQINVELAIKNQSTCKIIKVLLHQQNYSIRRC
jgi:hypothetical protein